MEIAQSLRPSLAALAGEGVFVGTSSWKYEGWAGQVYSPGRYETRHTWSQAKFERECLGEYSTVFPTVCVDAGYYKFPSEKYLEGLAAQVPDGFKFGFKVTDEITVNRFANLPRHGARAGQPNEHFLNADLFRSAFLRPCESIREKVGPLIFEFSTFSQGDFERGRDFIAALDSFLGALPKGWQFGVEIRNQNFLVPEYFEMLAGHNVAHVFNSWTRMPPVDEQLALTGSITADFTVARFLLRPGRSYDTAVKAFQPYVGTKEVFSEARQAAKSLIARAKGLARPSFVFVNNRLEGNAPATIAAILEPDA